MKSLFPGVRAGEQAPLLDITGGAADELTGGERPAAYTTRTGIGLRDQRVQIGAPEDQRWLAVNTTSIAGAGDGTAADSVLCSFADVTERERTRQELERSSRELQQAVDRSVTADRAKSRFLAATSHEIRTPLNGLLGFTGLLAHTELDPRQREYVTLARTCGEQLLALLNDVLDFSKAEAGQMRLDPVEMDLLALVDDALAIVAEPARSKGLAVCGVVTADVARRVVGDELRLRQALLNLLSNAVKFTATGDVELEVTCSGDLVRFAVHDTGIGVDPAVVPELFQPFTQAEAGTTRRFGGTGLGLAISREIARLHGGEVGAHPRAGGGSTFWFTARLPASGDLEPAFLTGVGVRVAVGEPGERRRLEQLVLRAGGHPGADLVVRSTPGGSPADLVIPVGASAREVLRRLAGGPRVVSAEPDQVELSGRVLIAEDNLINQRIATLLLEGMGLTVHVVGDGRQAVEAAAREQFALILMDCQMPEMDGLTATRTLRDQGCPTPVIAVTAAASRQDELTCREAGMVDYLTKPLGRELLVAALRRQLRPLLR